MCKHTHIYTYIFSSFSLLHTHIFLIRKHVLVHLYCKDPNSGCVFLVGLISCSWDGQVVVWMCLSPGLGRRNQSITEILVEPGSACLPLWLITPKAGTAQGLVLTPVPPCLFCLRDALQHGSEQGSPRSPQRAIF